ncbi:Oidioi.mRNA.OKI2018_I69.PAR.g12008.t2.cds [Oikopleura dioica]|uniref:Oidioi.mRNA.OKI2018_I69.PAR.g12008.t2.cds n=1 Tax=Oikopleura dioica TaxID=34765 RepID=A0ABN7S1F4_OIKDI|nr:Oidioi.mRNA.OKI2018_I69.PAR.g12008.t2.cds [Oikopleura dioica]
MKIFPPLLLLNTVLARFHSNPCSVHYPNNPDFYQNPCGIAFRKWMDAYHQNIVSCDGNWPKCSDTGYYLPQECHSRVDQYGEEKEICSCMSISNGEVLKFIRTWGGRKQLVPISSEYFDDFEHRLVCRLAQRAQRKTLDLETFCKMRYNKRYTKGSSAEVTGCVINGQCKKCPRPSI